MLTFREESEHWRESSVVQDDIEQRRVNRQAAVALDETSLRNLFMKKLTLERVVPTISASVSWLILAITGSGLLSFPKLASSRSTRVNRFSLELKRWSTRS